MWLNKFLQIIEALLWLKVIILTKISQDFSLIDKLFIWLGKKRNKHD